MNNQTDDIRKQLIDTLAELSGDPYAFVMWAFPWGKDVLKNHLGPEPWQKKVLCDIRDGLSPEEALQIAVASGHDIGKSGLIGWLVLWGISTKTDSRGVVTANTEAQLRQKTWAELSKWYNLFIAKGLFELTATAIFAKAAGHSKTWRFDIVPWSERNSESFAGLHNKNIRVMIIFDEASAIDDKIWEVSEGPMMDKNTERIWIAFGNPTRNTGRFYDCFHKFKHRWNHKQIDSREVSLADHEHIKKIIEDWGIDSDYVRVRIRGMFPSQSDRQYIPGELVEAARGKQLRKPQYDFAPVILGADRANYGSDESVIYLRQGLMTHELAKYKGLKDDIIFAGYLAQFEDEYKADAVFIDMGAGVGVKSAGDNMGRNWVLVPFAGETYDKQYLNKRAEIYGLAKDWLEQGGILPDDNTVCEQLKAPEYVIRLDGKTKVEAKEDLKKRIGCSPDHADALCLTFAHPVRKKTSRHTKEFYTDTDREYSVLGRFK